MLSELSAPKAKVTVMIFAIVVVGIVAGLVCYSGAAEKRVAELVEGLGDP